MSKKEDANNMSWKEPLGAPKQPEQELTPREILAYHEGELSEEEENQFLKRLAHDPSAVRDLLEMDQFPSQEEAPAMTPGELESAWQSFQQRVDTPGQPAAKVRNRAMWPAHPLMTALAACFLLVIGGLTFWIMDLKKTNRALLAPSLEAEVADLYLDDLSQRSQSGSDIPTLNKPMTFILHLSRTGETYNACVVEIQDPNGQTLFRETQEPVDKKLNLRLFDDYFPDPGIHVIAVYGLKNGQPVLLKNREFIVP